MDTVESIMEKRRFEMVYYTVDNKVAQLVLDRPDPLNSINDKLLSELNTALDELEKRERLRALIVEGEGDSFSSGADMEEAAIKYSINAGDAITYEDIRWSEDLLNTWQRLWDFPVVTIAKVMGTAWHRNRLSSTIAIWRSQRRTPLSDSVTHFQLIHNGSPLMSVDDVGDMTIGWTGGIMNVMLAHLGATAVSVP
jgi:hypothetical protein